MVRQRRGEQPVKVEIIPFEHRPQRRGGDDQRLILLLFPAGRQGFRVGSHLPSPICPGGRGGFSRPRVPSGIIRARRPPAHRNRRSPFIVRPAASPRRGPTPRPPPTTRPTSPQA